MGKLRGFVKLIRPDAAKFVFPVLIALVAVDANALFSPQAILILLTSMFSLYSIFAINQATDLGEDRLYPEKNPIVSGLISLKEARLVSISLAAMSVILSLFVSPWLLLTNLLALFFGWGYSVRPFRFKERFILDFVAHGFFPSLNMVGVWLSYSIPLLPKLFILFIGVFWVSVASLIKHQLLHWRNEKSLLKFTAARCGSETRIKNILVGLSFWSCSIVFLAFAAGFYLKFWPVYYLALPLPLAYFYYGLNKRRGEKVETMVAAINVKASVSLWCLALVLVLLLFG